MAASTVESKVFKSVEEAKEAFATLTEKEKASREIFQVTDPGKQGRDVHVVERTHPLARAAAALYWGVACSVAVAKPRQKPDPVSRAKNALARLSEEERAAIMSSLTTASLSS